MSGRRGKKRNTEVAETGAPFETLGKQRAQSGVVGDGALRLVDGEGASRFAWGRGRPWARIAQGFIRSKVKSSEWRNFGVERFLGAANGDEPKRRIHGIKKRSCEVRCAWQGRLPLWRQGILEGKTRGDRADGAKRVKTRPLHFMAIRPIRADVKLRVTRPRSGLRARSEGSKKRSEG